MVRIISMTGEEVLQLESNEGFSCVGELASHVASVMKVPCCSLVTSEHTLSAHLKLDATTWDTLTELTAVAQALDPLLVMLELQDPNTGELIWPNLEELHIAAAEAEERLIRCACGIGAPGHLCGMPVVEWSSKIVPPPAMFQQKHKKFAKMSWETPVIHAGARVLVFHEEGLGKKAAPPTEYIRDTPMTVWALRNICRDRPDLEQQKDEVKHIDGETIHPTIKMVSYSPQEIHFQLSHERYNIGDLWSKAIWPCRIQTVPWDSCGAKERHKLLPVVDASHRLLLLDECYAHKCCGDKMNALCHCVICFGWRAYCWFDKIALYSDISR